MARDRFYNHLRFKIIVGVVGLLTLTLSILFVIQYSQHREKMIRHLRENVSPHLSQMVIDVLKSSMVSKNRDEMKYILEVVRQYPDVKNVFILNRTGKVMTSTRDADVGTVMDLHDPTCRACHSRTTEALNKTVIYSLDREKIFRNVNPIYNRPECFECHPPSEKITGVLVTDFSLNNTERRLRAELKENLLLLFMALCVSTLAIGVALNQLVIKKIGRLAAAAAALGRGDFGKAVRFQGCDEIQGLADSFNELSRTLEDKKRLEQTYRRQIIEAQETERTRISRELHDEFGQALTAIKYNLEIMDKELTQPFPAIRERLGDTKLLSAQVLRDMRRMSMDLRPTMLDDVGLIPTLRWYIRNFSDRLNLASNFRASGFDEKKLPPQIETALYRIVQESLTNIAKHAQANRVDIHVERREAMVSASVMDDGKGFDPALVLRSGSPDKGIGIIGMQERVSLLGGKLDIQSSPESGTYLYVEIPHAGYGCTDE